MLVEEVYSSSDQVVSFLYDCLQLRNCRELFRINNVYSDIRHGDNEIGDLLVKFTLHLQYLLAHQQWRPSILPLRIHSTYLHHTGQNSNGNTNDRVYL